MHLADGHMGAKLKKWSDGEFSLSTLSAKDRDERTRVGFMMLQSLSKECL